MQTARGEGLLQGAWELWQRSRGEGGRSREKEADKGEDERRADQAIRRMQAAQKLRQTLVGGCSSEEESCSSESDSESGSEHEEGAQAIGRQVKVHYYWRMRGEWDPRRHEGVLRMNSSGKKVRVELCGSGGRVV